MAKKYVGVFCLQPGCKAKAVKSHRCKEHQLEPFARNYKNERTPTGWNQLREAIIRRDEGVCHLCGEYGADGVDHIENNDNHNPDNLKAVHDKQPNSQGIICHRYKTSQEGHEAKRRAKAQAYGTEMNRRLQEWVSERNTRGNNEN